MDLKGHVNYFFFFGLPTSPILNIPTAVMNFTSVSRGSLISKHACNMLPFKDKSVGMDIAYARLSA